MESKVFMEPNLEGFKVVRFWKCESRNVYLRDEVEGIYEAGS